MRNNKKGFTIVELVIVIAVIGILAAVLIPTFSSVTENARANARLQETRNVMTDYLAEKDGTIPTGTEFYYLNAALPEGNADGQTVNAYKFTFVGGKLEAVDGGNEDKTVTITVTKAENVTTIEIADTPYKNIKVVGNVAIFEPAE